MYHPHQRKRLHQRHEKYPHPVLWKRLLDYTVYCAGILGPVMTLPQVYIIWFQKNASGVSLVSWVSYFILGIPWFAYGLVHRERVIVFTYSVWFVMEIIIIAGILRYG